MDQCRTDRGVSGKPVARAVRSGVSHDVRFEGMVLTVRVLMGEERPGPSRRRVLRAALGCLVASIPLAGCDTSKPVRTRRITDPLNSFYHDTAALLAQYEAIMTAQPVLAARLAPLRDAHREHLRALAREIGPGLDDPSPAVSASGALPVDTSSVSALRAAEKEASAAARAACLAGPSYRAALLGSIAAARASHAEALS